MGGFIQPIFFARMNLQAAVERTVSALGYDPIEVERSARGLLRVTIDRRADDPTGQTVTVDDCEKVTRQLQYALEVDGVDYQRLEVSSPGLDRLLRHAADYQRFAGQQVELTLRVPFKGRRRWSGVLQARELGAADSVPVEVGQGAAASGPDLGWRLVLDDAKAAAAARKPGAKPLPRSPSRGRPAAAAKAAEGEAVKVLDFELAEVREARLVPVLNFKGVSPTQAAAPEQGAGAARD
jgi:ribosome maturation factor RimP